jgi:hypothetical protein
MDRGRGKSVLRECQIIIAVIYKAVILLYYLSLFVFDTKLSDSNTSSGKNKIIRQSPKSQ